MIVDTSFLVSLFLTFDVNHGNAVALMHETEYALKVPAEVIAELYTVLAYKANPGYALDVTEVIFHDTAYQPAGYLDQAAVLSFLKKCGSKISFTDAAVLTYSIAASEEILTFDRQLAKLGKRMKKVN